MSELIIGLIVGVAGGIAATVHVIKRYSHRDGMLSNLVRKVLGAP